MDETSEIFLSERTAQEEKEREILRSKTIL